MKSRTIIILWSIAIVLGVIACIVQFGGNDESADRTKLQPGDKILTDLPIAEITKVTISQGDNKTHLVRYDKDTWGVAERANYPVNYEKLRNLLGALSELEVAQGYPAGSEHYPRFGLAKSSKKEAEQGLEILMEKANDLDAANIFLGKFSGTNRTGGRFLRNANDNSGVYAVGETFPGITASPKDWLGTDFLEITKIKAISVAAPNDPKFKFWQLVRHPNTDGTVNENGQLKLAEMGEDEVMQLTSTNPLRNLLSSSSFLDIITQQQAKETANSDPKLKRIASISTFDGLKYTLTFWPQRDRPKDPKADPRLPAVQPNYLLTVDVTAEPVRDNVDDTKKDERNAILDAAQSFSGRIFQVSQSLVSPLQKKRSDFVKSKNKPTATTPPVRVPGLPPSAPSPAQP
ncbi:MAG: DUF4340 domain-containing protein [Akkermansiaceae bacterium]